MGRKSDQGNGETGRQIGTLKKKSRSRIVGILSLREISAPIGLKFYVEIKKETTLSIFSKQVEHVYRCFFFLTIYFRVEKIKPESSRILGNFV